MSRADELRRAYGAAALALAEGAAVARSDDPALPPLAGIVAERGCATFALVAGRMTRPVPPEHDVAYALLDRRGAARIAAALRYPAPEVEAAFADADARGSLPVIFDTHDNPCVAAAVLRPRRDAR